ncbi:MAG TPA: PKD domain-containing protein [Puia sp.]|jgi:hypothetical protein|nr:PKD domain-containing protein [Puia sp.]
MRSAFLFLSKRSAAFAGLAVFAAFSCLSGCTPDKSSASLGPLPKATFTIAPVSGAVNTYAASSGSTGVFSWYWDPGDGSGRKTGGANDTLYYAKKGNYRVVLLVLGHGGYDTTSQIVSVANDDPGINILTNPSLTTNSGWTNLNISGSVNPAFTAQGLNFTAPSGFVNGGVYQAITVKTGVPYTFSANVSGSGATNSWLEFYIGFTVPQQGTDYTDSKYYSLNTYNGCGGSPFNGNVVTIGCSGSGGKNGQITFSKSGTAYMVIKTGTNTTLGTGGWTVNSIGLNMPSH